MIPDYPWFGSTNGKGWGWVPVSWEGKLVFVAWMLALVAAYALMGKTRRFGWTVCGFVIALFLVCALTGTAPG
jgi:hypothetical protein